MPIPLAVPLAISLGSKLLGAFGKHKQKKAQEKAAAADSAAKFKQAQLNREARGKQHGVSEASRIATLKSILAMAGNRGIKGIDINSIDPSIFQPREFTEAEVVAPPTESGRSGFGEFLEGAGDVGQGVGDFMSQDAAKQKRQAETDKLMCIMNPAMCAGGQEKAGPPGGVIRGGLS